MGSGNPRTARKERKGGGPEDHNEKRDISRRLIVNASDDVFSNMQVRKENSSCRKGEEGGVDPRTTARKGAGPRTADTLTGCGYEGGGDASGIGSTGTGSSNGYFYNCQMVMEA